jgi:hypothetical protein
MACRSQFSNLPSQYVVLKKRFQRGPERDRVSLGALTALRPWGEFMTGQTSSRSTRKMDNHEANRWSYAGNLNPNLFCCLLPVHVGRRHEFETLSVTCR